MVSGFRDIVYSIDDAEIWAAHLRNKGENVTIFDARNKNSFKKIFEKVKRLPKTLNVIIVVDPKLDRGELISGVIELEGNEIKIVVGYEFKEDVK